MKIVKAIFIVTVTALSVQSRVIKSIDFSGESVGQYSRNQLNKQWNSPSWENGISDGRVHIVNDPAGKRGKVMRVRYDRNGVGPREGGAQWKMDLGKSYDTLYVSYMVMIPQDFDRVKGGKLPGLVGGTAPVGGDNVNGRDGFSARIMWRDCPTVKQAALTQYIYYMEKKGDWGEDFYWAHPNYNWASRRRFLAKGKWHTLKTRIIMNTPGQRNGKVTSWLDGTLALDTTLMLRARNGNFGIDEFYFSTFYGGGTKEWAPSKNEFIYFDRFIFSTKDIPEEVSVSRDLMHSKSSQKAGHFQLSRNVSDPGVTIRLTRDIPESSRLSIFTSKGMLVESITLQPSENITKVVGSSYSSGTYFAVLEVNSVTAQSRIFTITR